MIPRSKIDEIVDAARIEEVVGDYVALKKRGANMLGLCPFHTEKTPSFNVSPTRGIYKCFGCGKAGNSVTFIMEYEHLDYIQALKHLAAKYRIEWPEEKVSSEELEAERKKSSEKESLQIINNFAEEHFMSVLHEDEEGKAVGLSYFEERGFRPETIRRFRLGFSKDSWDHFTDRAVKGGFNPELLKRSGLVKESEQGKIYDAYRGRVIFPIHSLAGKPIAFAGRFLKKDPKSPKYVNSPETELYHKSNELYGLYFARQAISKAGYVYLVEGYTDVISMAQAGVENVVASSGTSLTENQIRLIRRFTENVCVLYDGDAAGIKASLRGIDMLLEGGLNVKVLLFPDGEDPDSYCKKVGPVEFSAFLEANKKDFILFKSSLLAEEAGNDPVKRAELLRSIAESIVKIPDSLKRPGLIAEASTLLGIGENFLVVETNRILVEKGRKERNEQKRLDQRPQSPQDVIGETARFLNEHEQERDFIRLILLYGDRPFEGFRNVSHYVLHELNEHEILIDDPLLMDFFSEVSAMLEDGITDVGRFTKHANPLISALAATVLTKPYIQSPNWGRKLDVIVDEVGTNYKSDIESALLRVKLKHIDKLILHNQEEFAKASSEEDVSILQKIQMHLIEQRKLLAASVGTVIVPLIAKSPPQKPN